MVKKHKIVGRKVKLVRSAKECGLSTYRQGPDLHCVGTTFVITDVWNFCVFPVVCKPEGHDSVLHVYTYHQGQLAYLNNKPVIL